MSLVITDIVGAGPCTMNTFSFAYKKSSSDLISCKFSLLCTTKYIVFTVKFSFRNKLHGI